MYTVSDRLGVFEKALVWHYDYDHGHEPICEGRKRCRIAIDDCGHVIDVAPRHALAPGLHWAASIAEVRSYRAATSNMTLGRTS